ncbi:MAG: ABC transporter substrate-binding protein [Oscillospiraceae bacterium]|nr:ABC transporter substrate-binding protein [Oscillospiraceae bacterium]
MRKDKIKKLLSLSCAAAMALTLAACSGGGAENSAAPSENVTAGEENVQNNVKIAILQYAPHPSLDNCYAGIIEGLASAGYVDGENGVTIDYQVGSATDPATCDMMAKQMISSGCDIMIAIATPAATSAYMPAQEANVPLIFSAVSDPVYAQLVQSLENPQSGVTGTSDALNLEGQLKMIRALMPEADTIGVLYTTSEANSISHLEQFKVLAPEYGFTVVDQGITNDSEVAAGATALVAKGVDCVNNFTDNNVVANLSTLLHATDEAGIPVFGSEEEQVTNGCVASESLDYINLGVQTGEMAAAVLGGADIMTMPVQVISESTPVYSAANCAKFGITIPADYADARNLDESE